MSVKRKYNKANIHINGKFVPSNKGKFILDAEYVRDDRTDKSLNETLANVENTVDNVEEAVDDLFDGNGKIKSDLLPSYVDDIHEFEEFSDFPETGETGIIYLDLETGYTYRWSGSEYVVHQAQADWGQTDATAPDYIKNKPTIPAAQIQADWDQSDNSALDYIKNKPSNILTDIPRILVCNTEGSNQVKIVNITTSELQILNNNDIVLFGILYDNTNTSGYTRLSFDNGATNTRISYGNSVTGADHKEVAGIAGRISYYLKSGDTIRWLYNDVNPYNVYGKAQDITATDLATAITNSTLVQYQLYYDTTNSKLLMATSNNTLVEISTTPYTPSV